MVEQMSFCTPKMSVQLFPRAGHLAPRQRRVVKYFLSRLSHGEVNELNRRNLL